MISYSISLSMINSREPEHQKRKLATSKNLDCTSPLSKIAERRICLAIITVAGLFRLFVGRGIVRTNPCIMFPTSASGAVH